MPLLNLPNEILYIIAKNLNAKDMSSLLLTNHLFTQITTKLLYELLSQDKDGLPALCWAAKKGYHKWCNFLLEKGTDVNVTCNNTHLTALHCAARSGHELVISLLLAKHANTEALDMRGETPLHSAAKRGHMAAAYMLLEKGARIDAVNLSRKIALSKAVKLLVKTCNREFENQEVRTAIFSRAEETAIMLLENGASVHFSNIYGETVLHEACGQSSVSVVKLILEKGGVLEARENHGDTALHMAAMYGLEGVARFLLGKGANIDVKNNDGYTPLHLAVEWQRESVLEMLIDERANINLINTDNYTPLALAVYRGYEKMAFLLL